MKVNRSESGCAFHYDDPATPASCAKAISAKESTAKTDKTNISQTEQAPGDADGEVWVNESSKVYHCEGDKDYVVVEG